MNTEPAQSAEIARVAAALRELSDELVEYVRRGCDDGAAAYACGAVDALADRLNAVAIHPDAFSPRDRDRLRAALSSPPAPEGEGTPPWMQVGRDDRSGCRRDCLHRAMVLEYRDSRHAWEERREDQEHYQLEDEEYAAMYPPPTFKAWLVGLAGRLAGHR